MFNFFKKRNKNREEIVGIMGGICANYSTYRQENQDKAGMKLLFNPSNMSPYIKTSVNTIDNLDKRELDECIAQGMAEQIAYSLLADSASQYLRKGTIHDFLSIAATPASEAILFIKYLSEKELEKGYITEEKHKEVCDWIEKTIQSAI